MDESIHRRDVLRSVGIAGTGGTVVIDGVPLSEATPVNHGPVRVVNAGIVYQFDTDAQLSRSFVEGSQLYTVQPGERVVLHPTAPSETRQLFERNDRIVGTGQVATPPVRLAGGEQTEQLVTRLERDRLPQEVIALSEPITPPTVKVKGTGKMTTVVAGGRTESIEPESRAVIALDSFTVQAQTFEVTDETVAVEGVPEAQWGPRTEFGETTLEVTPTVVVTDHGKLPVETL